MRSTLVVVAIALACTAQSHARASEWGCEVLLCAASDNPSWQAVATCRPPMERLIEAMKQPGFSWPTCPEGGAGEPGYERYADCPAGWTPSVGEVDSDHGSSDLSRCRSVVDHCPGAPARSGHGDTDGRVVTGDGVTREYSEDDHGSCIETMARPRRDKPYFFDIHGEDGSSSTREYFSLDR